MSSTVTDKKSDLERQLTKTVQRTAGDIPKTTKEQQGSYGAKPGPPEPTKEERFRGC